MTESIVFQNEGLNLYGMLHRPEGDGPFPAVVLCHGWTGHKVESSRIFVKVSRRLATAGIAAFPFDCRFSGESDGDFEDMTIASEISDAVCALQVAASLQGIDADRLGILGFSLGGTIASLAAQRYGAVKSICLWAPVSEPASYFGWMNEKMIGDTLDLGGMVQGRGFVEDLPNHKPVEAIAAYPGPVRVLHGTADTSVTLDNGRAYQVGPGRREMVEVEGADHAWLGADRQAILFDETVRWFSETL